MLSGRKAFPGATPAEVLVATLSSEPPDLSRTTSDVPPALARVVQCCLAKEPDDRYTTVHDLRLALDSAEEQLGRRRWFPRARPGPAARRWVARVLAGVLLAAVAWRAWPLIGAHRLPTFTPRQVTSGAGSEEDPALSPDGGFVAYTAAEGGNSEVWIADLQGDATLRLTTDEAWDESPSWFPDGGEVVFVSDRGGQSGVWKVSRLGGQPRLLVPNAFDPAVSPDGRLLAFTRPNEQGYRKLAVAALDRPDDVRFLSSGGLRDDDRPVWSPDGRTLLYADFNHLWLVDVDGGEAPRRLTAEGEIETDPAWSPDGVFVYFSAVRDGLAGIWRRRVSGGEAEPVERGPGAARWPSVSRDGRRLVFSSSSLQETLVAVETSTGRRARFEEAWRTLTPTVAPDGRAVLFVSSRQNAVDLWQLPLEGDPLGGSPQRVTDNAGRTAWPRYSADGRWIAYQGNVDGQRDVWTVPREGGPGRRFTEHPAEDTVPAWSPDGSRIAFVSDRGGEDEVWVAPVDEGRRVGDPQRLASGTESVVWSPDGRRLAYIATVAQDNDVWVVAADGSGSPERLTDRAGAVQVRWVSPGGLLVLGLWGGHVPELRFLDPETRDSAPAPHSEVSGPFSQIQTFDVSPDGRWLILLEENHRGDVWVLDAQDGSF